MRFLLAALVAATVALPWLPPSLPPPLLPLSLPPSLPPPLLPLASSYTHVVKLSATTLPMYICGRLSTCSRWSSLVYLAYFCPSALADDAAMVGGWGPGAVRSVYAGAPHSTPLSGFCFPGGPFLPDKNSCEHVKSVQTPVRLRSDEVFSTSTTPAACNKIGQHLAVAPACRGVADLTSDPEGGGRGHGVVGLDVVAHLGDELAAHATAAEVWVDTHGMDFVVPVLVLVEHVAARNNFVACTIDVEKAYDADVNRISHGPQAHHEVLRVEGRRREAIALCFDERGAQARRRCAKGLRGPR